MQKRPVIPAHQIASNIQFYSMNDIDISENTIDSILNLGKLLLQFGRVHRITYHEDGVTPESDTDHTVMLSIIACAYAAKVDSKLDIGKIAQFCLIHDLVEVYAQDTPTLRILTETEKQEKRNRETFAYERIKKEFGEEFPWLIDTMYAYETLQTPEARFVKVIDKIMPKITHILNNGITVHQQKQGEHLVEIHKQQLQDMLASYAHDQPEAVSLWKKLTERLHHTNTNK